MAGLVDAYLYAGNEKALRIALGMADWAADIVNPLADEKRLKMLYCEYGGMNEVLVNLYAVTAIKKYLDLSLKFHDEFVMGSFPEGLILCRGSTPTPTCPRQWAQPGGLNLPVRRMTVRLPAFFGKPWYGIIPM
jgi:DUF1680 family protein